MHSRRRNSYIETSYTGVGAFSSAPAPHTNALAAASAIGNALKSNNQNLTNLNIPPIQAPKSSKQISRSPSMTSNAHKRTSLVQSSSITQAYINQSRNNSIDTANARRLSLSSIPKQRLLSQKSTPNLKSRRSISDLTNSHSSTVVRLPPKDIPRTIKKYIPSANGLVAIEVPNPDHPDNMKPSNHQPRNSLYRRSISMANVSVRAQQQQQQQLSLKQFQQPRKANSISNYKSIPSKVHSHSLTGGNASRSITKNIKRQTKILSDGTKVISTTVEKYIQVPPNELDNDIGGDTFDDSYDDFDDDHREIDMTVTLNDIHSDILEEDEEENEENEVVVSDKRVLDDDLDNTMPSKQKDVNISKPESEADKIVDELASEIKYEDDAKKMIELNEKVEQYEREKAFKSASEPVQDPVIIEEIVTRKFTNGLHPESAATFNSAVHLSDITGAGLGRLTSNKRVSTTVSHNDNIDNSYNDFYEEEYQRSTAENKDIDNLAPEQVEIDNNDDGSGYIDDIEEGDYVDDIDEDIQPQSNTLNEYSEEEYLAAQRKLDALIKQKEQEILNEMIRNGEISKEGIDITKTNYNDSGTKSICSDGTDFKKEIQSAEQIPMKSSPSQQSIKLSEIDQKLDLSKRSSSVYSLADENVQGSLTIGNVQGPERFCTPPITPDVDVVNPITKKSSDILADKVNESIVETSREPPVFVKAKTKSKVPSTETPFSNIRGSESPKSSMIHDSHTSVATTPIKNSHPKQSMAQQLRATVTIPRSPIESIPIIQSNINDNNDDILFPIPKEVPVKNEKGISELSNLEVPKREPSIQAKIDKQEKLKTHSTETIEDIEDINRAPDIHQLNNSNTSSSISVNNKRKSVLKNSSTNRLSLYASNNQTNASDAYLSLTTAQNTKMNSISPLNQNPGPGPVSSRRLSVNTLQDRNINQRPTRSRSCSTASTNAASNDETNTNSDIAPLAAATKAAQRQATQSSALSTTKNNRMDTNINRNSTLAIRDNYPVNINLETAMANVGSVKAVNPNVERAKKRILQNRPAKNRAKELYELAKTRAPIKPDALVALDDSPVRRSSFEKVEPHHANNQNDLAAGGSFVKGKMSELSLRDHNSLDYEEYERKSHVQRNFKSRFADNDSDTDIPLLTLLPNTGTSDSKLSSPAVLEKTRSGFKFKLGNKKKTKPDVDVSIVGNKPNLHFSENEAHQQLKNNTSHKESKFEKFFAEPHGPGHRSVSTASAITTDSVTTEGGKKKKGFFKKMFN